MSEENIWKKLTRLFRNGPVVRHKISFSSQMNEPQGTASSYKKELSSLYVNSLASYGQYERLARYADYSEMIYCLHGDTLIATPNGFEKIKDLAEKYGMEEKFIVYSYDHTTKTIVPAYAKQARKTRVAEPCYKVKFDNGKEIIGTEDHRLMLRDGTYKKICDLLPGDSMMPFKRKSFYDSKTHSKDGGEYQFIYTMTKDSKNGWIAEHKLIAEWFNNVKMLENEVVHHIDFKKNNNFPSNLRIMDRKEHNNLHSQIFNKNKWNKEKNKKWINEFKQKHSQFMKDNNPSVRKDVTFSNILQVAEKNCFNLYKTSKTLNVSIPCIKQRLKEYSFSNWESFAKSYDVNWKNNGWDNNKDKNPRFDHSLTFQKICDSFTPGMNGVQIAKKLNTTTTKILNRVKDNGFKNLTDFCQNYLNCKVVSVEYHGIEDVYDFTVDGYKNFATDSVISHNTPEIASALDIYSDEITSLDEQGRMINIVSEDEEIKAILETLFFDILNIEFNLHSWVKNLCKYGDFILFVDASDTNGILNLLPIPINEIEREEGYDKQNPFAFRFRWLTQGNMILEAWQIIHFRLLGNDNFLPYGSSLLEPARRIWRQLILIEDAMMVYRIIRSPERRVFKIEVGNLKPEDIDLEMNKVISKFKRAQVIDSSTGRVDLRYNPLSVDEDYFLPMRDGKGSAIETLAGGQFTGDIEDVQYIQSKLFAALKVPKAYLGYDDVGSKATLAQEDVRFSRSIQRMQKIILSELSKIAIIHLFLLGKRDAQLTNFEIKMANPSTIAEQQKLELWRMKLEICGIAQEGTLDKKTIWKDLFGFSEEKIQQILDGLKEDKLFQLEVEAVTLPEEEVPGEEGLPEELPDEEPVSPDEEEQGGEEEPQQEESVQLLEKENPGSEGDQAEISVDKGKNLFSTGEDQFNHVFGTEKQTASDPYDTRFLKRFVSKPFSEKLNINKFINQSLNEIDISESKLKNIENIVAIKKILKR